MNKKYPIRTTALILLENIYINSNYNLQATINANSLVNKEIDIQTIQKAATYLKEKDYIRYDIAPHDKWTVTITAKGIDWVEECHNITPMKSIKE